LAHRQLFVNHLESCYNLGDLKKLGKETVIYGVGHVAARMVTFFLLPLYSHTLAPEQYGVVSLVYVLVAFMNVIYIHGTDSSFLKFFGLSKNSTDKSEYFSTVWLWGLGISIFLSLFIFSFAQPIAIITVGSDYSRLISISAGILFFDALVLNPKILLRLQGKPMLFIIVEMLNVIVIMGLNVYWIGFRHFGIEYIFYSNLVASALVFIAILFIFKSKLYKNWKPNKLKNMLLFGLPFIPAGLASMTSELIDRYMIKWFSTGGDYAVGIYNAGYKLGIFMLIIVTAFKFAWQPFFLGKSDESDSHETFSRVGTYFIALSLFILLGITFLTQPLVELTHFLGEQYLESLEIVPIVLLAYVFLGVATIQLAGIYIKSKPGWIPVLNGGAAVVNVIMNYLLIKVYGFEWQGAAWATLISYAFLVIFQYFVIRRFYELSWEWTRIIKVLLVTGIVFALWFAGLNSVVFSILLLLFYPIGLFYIKFFNDSELSFLSIRK
jgi:O-antigen/teichoic acid export membrane protein